MALEVLVLFMNVRRKKVRKSLSAKILPSFSLTVGSDEFESVASLYNPAIPFFNSERQSQREFRAIRAGKKILEWEKRVLCFSE
ncbi:hypothetical protein Nepgr_027072 [Nepenthes gracilis]|uniref:Uncharacterized protein n=1 Tax=Nepenthes gracilis TaxID=150966 RepID=A0AAD3Y2R6_NEPGR|nr:hypothetical protein Nepgr_027072 [Nepenthes gracilis]